MPISRVLYHMNEKNKRQKKMRLDYQGKKVQMKFSFTKLCYSCKFIVHILLVLLVSIQMILFSSLSEVYLYAAGQNIVNSFLPAGFESPIDSGTGYSTHYFFQTKDVIDFVQQSVRRYYYFSNHSIDYMFYRPMSDIIIENEDYSSEINEGKVNEDTSKPLHSFGEDVDGYRFVDTNTVIKQQIQSQKRGHYDSGGQISNFSIHDVDRNKSIHQSNREDQDRYHEKSRDHDHHDADDSKNLIDRDYLNRKIEPANPDFVMPLQMKVEIYKNLHFKSLDVTKPIDRTIEKLRYDLTLYNPLGPFHPNITTDVQEYIQRVVHFELMFTFKTFYIGNKYPECLQIPISLSFDFTVRGGRVPLYVKYDIQLCSTSEQATVIGQLFSSPLVWISILIIILGMVSMISVSRSIWKTYQMVKTIEFRSMRMANINEQRTNNVDQNVEDLEDNSLHDEWSGPSSSSSSSSSKEHENILEQVPLNPTQNMNQQQQQNAMSFNIWDKLSYFNAWYPITLLASCLSILSSFMTICNAMYAFYSLNPTNVALGVSAILVWTNIVQYFSHAPKFYILITALRKGLPNVIRFVLGATPILVGYAMCGTILFGSYSKYFRDIPNSLLTLFSLANGDVLRDTLDMIYGQNPLIAMFSRFYLVSFIVLFTYSVINIFILIMEDAFYDVKEMGIGKVTSHNYGHSSGHHHHTLKYRNSQGGGSNLNFESSIADIINDNDTELGDFNQMGENHSDDEENIDSDLIGKKRRPSKQEHTIHTENIVQKLEQLRKAGSLNQTQNKLMKDIEILLGMSALEERQ